MATATTNLCRLCVNICQEGKSLYDENGQQNLMYEITRQYFHPTIVNLVEAQHLRVICLFCWRQICDFRSFQASVEAAQLKLSLNADENKVERMIGPVAASLSNEGYDIHSVSWKTEEEFIAITEVETPNACNEHEHQDGIENDLELANSARVWQEEPNQFDLSCNIKVENPEITTEFIAHVEPEYNQADKFKSEPESSKFSDIGAVESFSSDDDLPLSSFADKAKIIETVKNTSMDQNSSNSSELITALETSSASSSVASKEPSNTQLNAPRAPASHPRKTDSVSHDNIVASWIPTIKCVACPETFTKYSLYRQHFRQDHPSEEFHILCCNRKFFIQSKIKDHILFHRDPNTFKCHLCGGCYSNTMRLNRHISTLHPKTQDRKFKCSQCSKAFTTQRACTYHYTINHRTVKEPEREVLADGVVKYSCKDCSYATNSAQCFTQHQWYNHHLQPKHTCNICGKSFKLLVKFRKHAAVHTNLTPFSCSLCPNVFKTLDALKVHTKVRHGDIDQPKPSSSATTAEPQGVHLNVEGQNTFGLVTKAVDSSTSETRDTPEDTSGAIDGERSSTSKTGEPREMGEQTKSQQLDDLVAKWLPMVQCNVCPDTFASLSLLQHHFRQQHKLEKFYISCCALKLVQRNTIEDHFLLHSNDDAFKCHICEQRHNHRLSLQQHMARRHPETFETTYQCTECRRSFLSKGGIAYHYSVSHKGVRYKPPRGEVVPVMHPCKECGKVFQKLKGLNYHMWCHRNKDKHACSSCGKTFKHVATLRLHEAKHKPKPTTKPKRKPKPKPEPKPKPKPAALLKCTTCGKKFKEDHELNTHMATHRSKGYYSCPFCPMSFINLSNSELHRKMVHPQDEETLKDTSKS